MSNPNDCSKCNRKQNTNEDRYCSLFKKPPTQICTFNSSKPNLIFNKSVETVMQNVRTLK